MDLDNEVFDWIERYLTGDMNADELLHFEMLVKNDASLRSKVDRQKSFSDALSSFGRREQLKANLNRFHQSIDIDGLVEQYIPRPALIYQLWKKHRIGLAVAASVIILAISGSMYYMNLVKIDSQISQVRALKRDVEKVKSNQNVLNSHINNRRGHSIGTGNYGGTGFLIDNKGFLVTNYHVVDGADSVFVQSNKGQTYQTTVIYRNKDYDLAILQIKDTAFKSPVSLPYTFNRVQPELGEQVYTLGYPRDEIVYNEGYMSSATGFNGDTISYQLSIPVNPGNSGGPVLDNHGNVLGIISGKQTQVEGVAFAVRSSYLVKAINDAKNDSLKRKISLPMKLGRQFSLSGTRRTQQVKKLEDFIYIVKAFN